MRHRFDHPLHGCTSCGLDFSGLGYFDRHRVGDHEFTYSEGLKFDPPREDGRRCLDTDELTALGYSIDKNGRWSDPASAARVAARFTSAAASSGVSRGGPPVPGSTTVVSPIDADQEAA